MSCALTAYSVKIVASGETAIKGAIAREVLYEWNADRSWEEKKAFLPLLCEQAGETPPADLLVAFFRASQKSCSSPDIDLEIQRHAGRPILIYISEARTDFAGAEFPDLKSSFPAEAMIDSFKDEKEFRSKFARKIDALVRYHRQFKTGAEVSTGPASASSNARPAAQKFSQRAQDLLVSACDDPEAYVARMKDSRGLKIQVNGRQVVEAGDPDSAAQWESAFNELLDAGLIRDAGYNGQLFQISSKGFAYLETLGKHPIGYIAELGGM